MKVLRFVFGRRQFLRRRKREIMAALKEKGAAFDEGLTTIRVEGGAAFIKFLRPLEDFSRFEGMASPESIVYELEPLQALPEATLASLRAYGARQVA